MKSINYFIKKIDTQIGGMEQQKFNDICKIIMISAIAIIFIIAYWNWLYE